MPEDKLKVVLREVADRLAKALGVRIPRAPCITALRPRILRRMLHLRTGTNRCRYSSGPPEGFGSPWLIPSLDVDSPGCHFRLNSFELHVTLLEIRR